MNELNVKKTVIVNAGTETVWEALTKPEWTKKYMLGIEVISDWKVGSPILWKGRSKGEEKIVMKGSIEKIEAGKLLQYTSFNMNANCFDIPSNYVKATFELTPKFGKTVLSMTQGDYSRVTDGKKRFDNADGAWNQTLNALKLLVEKEIIIEKEKIKARTERSIFNDL